MKFVTIGPAVSQEALFKIVDGRWMDDVGKLSLSVL